MEEYSVNDVGATSYVRVWLWLHVAGPTTCYRQTSDRVSDSDTLFDWSCTRGTTSTLGPIFYAYVDECTKSAVHRTHQLTFFFFLSYFCFCRFWKNKIFWRAPFWFWKLQICWNFLFFSCFFFKLHYTRNICGSMISSTDLYVW